MRTAKDYGVNFVFRLVVVGLMLTVANAAFLWISSSSIVGVLGTIVASLLGLSYLSIRLFQDIDAMVSEKIGEALGPQNDETAKQSDQSHDE